MSDENIDWIARRADCSVATAMAKLRMQIKQDVESRDAALPPGTHYKFRFVSEGDDFMVIVEGFKVKGRLYFDVKDDGFVLLDSSDRAIMRAVVALNDELECVFKVGDKELNFWQVRRRALEGFLFYAY